MSATADNLFETGIVAVAGAHVAVILSHIMVVVDVVCCGLIVATVAGLSVVVVAAVCYCCCWVFWDYLLCDDVFLSFS